MTEPEIYIAACKKYVNQAANANCEVARVILLDLARSMVTRLEENVNNIIPRKNNNNDKGSKRDS